MSEPIIFISRNRIREGKAEEFKQHYLDSIQLIFDGKPDTLTQLAYTDKEGAEFTIVRLFSNADALDFQLQGTDERSKKTYTFIEPTGIEIFGTPNQATIEKMKKIAGSGITVNICPNYIGGFIR